MNVRQVVIELFRCGTLKGFFHMHASMLSNACSSLYLKEFQEDCIYFYDIKTISPEDYKKGFSDILYF